MVVVLWVFGCYFESIVKVCFVRFVVLVTLLGAY